MSPRQRRMVMVAAIVGGVSLAAWLGSQAFRENFMYFINPTQVAAGEFPKDRRFELGGMVAKDSVHKTPGTLDVQFNVTDFVHTVTVKHSGVLPDLFRDGQGVVVHGRMQGEVFVADRVLAKHDEKYMPPQVAKSLQDNPPPPNATPPPGEGT
jgi:cytochrome c-type biogenesis protein CcmE